MRGIVRSAYKSDNFPLIIDRPRETIRHGAMIQGRKGSSAPQRGIGFAVGIRDKADNCAGIVHRDSLSADKSVTNRQCGHGSVRPNIGHANDGWRAGKWVR